MTAVLFVGDAAATGFGTVTADLGRGLLTLGLDVRFLSMNQTGEPLPEPFGSRTMFVEPEMRPNVLYALLLGQGAIKADGTPDDWRPDAVVICADFYSTDWIGYIPQLAQAFKQVPTFHYCPIEGDDLPPAWKRLWEILTPVAMSEFGVTEMAKILGYRPPMVYHGVDQETFYPISRSRPADFEHEGLRPISKRDCKRFFGLDPDRMVILRTDRHMPRKLYNSLLRALYPVFEHRPNVDLLVHCDVMDEGGRLPYSLSKYPRWFGERVRGTNAIGLGGSGSWTGLPREALNILYNAADIYCSTGAEGFGLTLAEAIACGVPAVGIDYSAVPEVIGPAGKLVPIAYRFDNPYDHYWAAVDEGAYSQTVLRLIDSRGLRRTLGEAGPPHVAEHFSWSKAASQFATLINEACVMEQTA